MTKCRAVFPGSFRLIERRKLRELPMPVPLVKVSYNFSIEQVERGKRSGGSVPLVVVGHGAAAAFLERQARLGPIERLYLHPSKQRPLAGDPSLAFLIDAKDDRLVRRIDVEPDHVCKFLQKPGARDNLKVLARCGLRL